MKFKLSNAKYSEVDSEIEINTIEELINLVDNIKDSDWSTKRIILSEAFSYGRTQDKYKYEITIYNSYME